MDEKSISKCASIVGSIRTKISQAKSESEKFEIIQSELSLIKNKPTKKCVEVFIGVLLSNDFENEKVVILIHGIRDHGAWQDKVKGELSKDQNITVYPIGYGDYFTGASFIFTFITQRKQISKIKRELRHIKSTHPLGKQIIICHSFGTYLISKILISNSDIKIDSLILCGSIIPSTYPWHRIPNTPTDIIINDVGTSDRMPPLAKFWSYRFGTTGTFGFKTSAVKDRYHNFGHSGFFDLDFIRKYWVPYIENENIIDPTWSAERNDPSWIISVYPKIPFKSLMLLLVLFLYRNEIYDFIKNII